MYRQNWVNVCKKIPLGAYSNEYVVKEKIHVIGLMHVSHKNQIKDWWLEPSQGTQKGKAKNRPKDAQPARTKKRERASPFHGGKLSHPQPL